MSKIAKVKQYDIANGSGIRTSIFFSGCTFECGNCFNKDVWDFNVGEDFNLEFYESKIKPTINEHISGISIAGGEPLHPKNIEATLELILLFKMDFPNKNIWLWSGFEWDELMVIINKNSNCDESKDWYKCKLITTLFNIDMLIDGRFIESKKDLTLKWRGSSNQRVIDVQKSLGLNKIILYDN